MKTNFTLFTRIANVHGGNVWNGSRDNCLATMVQTNVSIFCEHGQSRGRRVWLPYLPIDGEAKNKFDHYEPVIDIPEVEVAIWWYSV